MLKNRDNQSNGVTIVSRLKHYSGDFRVFGRYVAPANPHKSFKWRNDSSQHLKEVRLESNTSFSDWPDGSPRFFSKGSSARVVTPAFLTELSVARAERELGGDPSRFGTRKRSSVRKALLDGDLQEATLEQRTGISHPERLAEVQVDSYHASKATVRVRVLPDGREIEEPIEPRNPLGF